VVIVLFRFDIDHRRNRQSPERGIVGALDAAFAISPLVPGLRTGATPSAFSIRMNRMASAPALPEATVSGQFVQIFGRKENPRGGDVLVKVRHR
jgi:hypothetical protein